MSNAEAMYRQAVAFQIFRFDLLIGFAFPDIAHDAAAIASAMNIQDENG